MCSTLPACTSSLNASRASSIGAVLVGVVLVVEIDAVGAEAAQASLGGLTDACASTPGVYGWIAASR